MTKKIIAIYFINILLCPFLFAEQIPAGQDAGSVIKEYIKEKEEKKRIKRLIAPKIKPPAPDEDEAEALPNNAESIYINKIMVQQNVYADDYLKKGEFNNLTKQYENRTLSLYEMKELAKTITQNLLNKELKAYVPKQSFAGDILYINLISEKL
ncbi:MAG: hypothetical protein KAU58_00205 [Candidatus Omnitrophica bacterium]|nr:hypothetical protein [Candidatus Omnitrophota bacterium]